MVKVWAQWTSPVHCAHPLVHYAHRWYVTYYGISRGGNIGFLVFVHRVWGFTVSRFILYQYQLDQNTTHCRIEYRPILVGNV